LQRGSPGPKSLSWLKNSFGRMPISSRPTPR
jgi:hypothetical protein